MTRRTASWQMMMVVVALTVTAPAALAAGQANGWISLFDGKTLAGWVQHNGTATYRVEDGTIVGKTTEGSPNSFLCTKKTYGDFELTFDVKVDDALNSGVQIRSRSLQEYKDGLVHGPQVEIKAAPGEAGYVYSEGTGRGWLSTTRDKLNTFKNGAWNSYRVRALGPRIQTWVNDQPVADLTDEQSSRSGFVGLQVHGIQSGTGPFEVRWRKLRLRELKP